MKKIISLFEKFFMAMYKSNVSSHKAFNKVNCLRQKVYSEVKNGKLLLKSVWLMKAGNDIQAVVELPKEVLTQLKSMKDYHSFRDKVAEFGIQRALLSDSIAKKNLLTKNTQYDSICDILAEHLQPAFRVIESRKKLQAIKTKSHKAKKVIVKKAMAKKA